MKTKRIRIAVMIDSNGVWNSAGWSDCNGNPVPDDDLSSTSIDGSCCGAPCGSYWIEADVPLPEKTVVQGEVKS